MLVCAMIAKKKFNMLPVKQNKSRSVPAFHAIPFYK